MLRIEGPLCSKADNVSAIAAISSSHLRDAENEKGRENKFHEDAL